MTTEPGTLYLIPTPLGRNAEQTGLPADTIRVLRSITHFAVENLKNAVSFLKFCEHPRQEFELFFYSLDKNTPARDAHSYMDVLRQGHDLGVLTDAGCPGIADPGAMMAGLAHQQGYRVVPLVGPSSILLALMASGLNGQQFAFSGYLPIEKKKRRSTIAEIEKHSSRNRETRIFMEAPYRNMELFNDIIEICSDSTLICIATNLTLKDEYVATKSVAAWKSGPLPDIDKKPSIFLLHAENYLQSASRSTKKRRY
ncbi:MAG: SAM-dependent methyltransferase [Cyclonatronaceae bacterium]